MTKWLREVEPIIRKLCADHNVCDPQELVSFTETNNLELEIEKKDGSKVRILKRLLGRCDYQFWKNTGLHQPSQFGSVIDWGRVDWGKYDQGDFGSTIGFILSRK